MPIPTPGPAALGLDAAVSSAVTIITATNSIWLFMIGLAIGLVILGLILKAVRDVLGDLPRM